jgi:hypothetical protein
VKTKYEMDGKFAWTVIKPWGLVNYHMQVCNLLQFYKLVGEWKYRYIDTFQLHQSTFWNRLLYSSCPYSEISLNLPALGPKNLVGLNGWPILWDFRIVRQGLKKSAYIQGRLVFWGCSLEEFHCVSFTDCQTKHS